MHILRRNSRLSHANGSSAIPGARPSFGACREARDSCISGGGPFGAARPAIPSKGANVEKRQVRIPALMKWFGSWIYNACLCPKHQQLSSCTMIGPRVEAPRLGSFAHAAEIVRMARHKELSMRLTLTHKKDSVPRQNRLDSPR